MSNDNEVRENVDTKQLSETDVQETAAASEKDNMNDLSGKMAEKKEEMNDFSGKQPGKQEEKINIKKEVISWIRTFAITIGIVLVLLLFVFINAQVPSESMESTIMTKDRLIGFRFSYWFNEPQRGDIILFKFPVDETETYIKRVIGLPGETVTIEDAHVYIDDSEVPLEETYLKEDWVWENDGFTFQVPEDCYFVMGDNRNNSEDSRFWAEDALRDGVATSEEDAYQYTFVKREQIKGKAMFVYYRHPRMLNQNPYTSEDDNS